MEKKVAKFKVLKSLTLSLDGWKFLILVKKRSNAFFFFFLFSFSFISLSTDLNMTLSLIDTFLGSILDPERIHWLSWVRIRFRICNTAYFFFRTWITLTVLQDFCVVREELQECAQVQGPPHGRENQQEREEKQGQIIVDYAMVVT